MKPLLKRIAVRLVIANLLVLPALLLLITLSTSNAAAADASGTWSSNVSGKGYVQTSHILDTDSDVKLVLTQNGNAVSGTIYTTCSYAYLHPGYENWGSPSIGQKNTNTVSGTLSGTTLTLVCYSPATSGTSGGVSYTAPATTTTWTLLVNGDRLTGSGTYVSGGITYGYVFDLKSGDSSSAFGSLSLGNGSLTIPAVIAIIGGGACLAASFIPLPKGNPVLVANGASYQPSDARTVSADSGAPTDTTPVGGVGLTYPQDYVNGVPVRPRQWQSQQHGPQCPIHGTMCDAHYPNAQDLGAWFCPKCAEQGRDGFPWGRN